MSQIVDILEYAHRAGADPSMDLLYQKEQNIPGAIKYSIRRYFAQHALVAENVGMMLYNYEVKNSKKNYLEFRFCVTGNRICEDKPCSQCQQKPTTECDGKYYTVDIFSFHFTAIFLHQFTSNVKTSSYRDDILTFQLADSFTKTFPICEKKRNILDTFLNHSYTGAMENIFLNAKAHELLLYSLDCFVGEKDVESFTCKFLENEYNRKQIYLARDILLQHIGNPLTIKELSRKVALNECYLKKGFREIFGTTIFDFFQQQRMEHAKYLLYEKGLSVTDVSLSLGYSSISHFSVAFKKHTGLKPCDLLSIGSNR